MSDEADVAEIERFNKQNLKRVEIQKKNPLPSKETTELERQTDESSRGMHAKMHWQTFYLRTVEREKTRFTKNREGECSKTEIHKHSVM
ncbi:thymosin beta-4-like [Ictidomys tridecemlineatus]|uniref:thymosin beta-4-like n=1 Tax=Ictidomys tridecemlineatus TaxID=43179 RepID=UPI000B5494A8|nr:thymosin beta-4-like [Ictidomys tridecemlineatus]KAG3277642.1 thymosin beta-4-like [Ictidomys tridecemlineatus]